MICTIVFKHPGFEKDGLPPVDSYFEVDEMVFGLILSAISKKAKADAKWPAPVNLHESYGLMLEEVDEFKQQVFLQQPDRSLTQVHSELSDIINVCLRTANVDIRK